MKSSNKLKFSALLPTVTQAYKHHIYPHINLRDQALHHINPNRNLRDQALHHNNPHRNLIDQALHHTYHTEISHIRHCTTLTTHKSLRSGITPH